MEILGKIMIIVGFVIMAFNGSPTRWEKGTNIKHILIEAGGMLVLIAGFWLLDK